MSGFDDALERARAAVEEYDYEAAAAAFQEAYGAKKVKAAFLEEYAAFLLDSFGDYPQALALLRGESKALGKSVALQRALIRAAWYAEDVAAGLEAVRAYPDAGVGDTDTGITSARLFMSVDDWTSARASLTEALRTSPSQPDARKLLEEVQERLDALVAQRLGEIDALLNAERFDEAEAIIDQALAVDPEANEAHRARKQLVDCRDGLRAVALMEGAQEALSAGDAKAALRGFEEAYALAPETGGLAEGMAVARDAVFESMCVAIRDRADEAFAEGDLPGAARGFVEMLRISGAERYACDLSGESSALFALVAEQRDVDAGATESVAGLAALVRLFELERSGAAEGAELATLQALKTDLGALPRLGAWIDAAEARAGEELLRKQEATWLSAEAAERAGDQVRAAEMYRSLGDYRDADARAKRLSAAGAAAERTRLQLVEIRRAVDDGAAFKARRLLREAAQAEASDVFAELKVEVEALMESSFAALPAVPILSDAFDRFPLVPGGYVRHGEQHLAVIREGSLLIWNLDDCKDDGVWDLPEAFKRPHGRFRLLSRDPKTLLFVDLVDRSVLMLDAQPGRMPTVLDRYSLERILPADLTNWRVSLQVSSDGKSLLILVSHSLGDRKPMLTVLDLSSARVANENEFGFHVFRLIPVAGRRDVYGVSRMYVNSTKVPAPRYDFALVNERGRVETATRFDGIGEPVNGLRRIVWVEKEQKYFFSYDYFDPFTSQLSDESIGLGIVDENFGAFFQESRMEDKLGSRRYVVGDVSVFPELDRLVLPFRDDERRLGLAVFPLLEPSRPEEIQVGEGDLVLDLFPKGDGRSGHLLIYDREQKTGRCAPYGL